jgi:UDP-3-O-[3-hydroxymyristoyl] N-acetylglucosamine deacetylase
VTSVTIEGQGLHRGAHARLRFVREAGPVRLRSGGVEARIDELLLDGSARSTCASTRDGRLRIATVEHLFAALGASAIREGVVIEIDGPEIPLVDGGARAFVDALARLEVQPHRAPSLRVERAGSIEVGASLYELFAAAGAEVRVAVEVDFGDARLERHAQWDGDALDFRERIAPARTFGFEHEVNELMARGLASHVAPASVVVIAPTEILSAGPSFRTDEPARHKLLDLIGDLYAHGGPPLGSVRATRPGHAATHEAVRRALDRGLLVFTRTG